jgi:hypothetical protein
LNVVANKNDYLAALRSVIWKLYQCGAVWEKTVPVHEVFQGKTVWQGDVEVFQAMQHPKAKRVYAWGYTEGDKTNYTAVLELPPVESPETAVRAAIMRDG